MISPQNRFNAHSFHDTKTTVKTKSSDNDILVFTLCRGCQSGSCPGSSPPPSSPSVLAGASRPGRPAAAQCTFARMRTICFTFALDTASSSPVEAVAVVWSRRRFLLPLEAAAAASCRTRQEKQKKNVEFCPSMSTLPLICIYTEVYTRYHMLLFLPQNKIDRWVASHTEQQKIPITPAQLSE